MTTTLRIGKRKIKPFRSIWYFVLAVFAFAALFPAVFMLINSFLGEKEIMESYGAVFVEIIKTPVDFHLIPRDATIQGYTEVFLLTPKYLLKFWNSMFLSLSILAGQVVVACVSGYGFAKFRFKYRDALFYLMVILMMTPNQVTLVSNYMVLDYMGLIGSYLSIIIPGVFSMFGVFLMCQVYTSVPSSLMEAAKIDGAGHFKTFYQIMIPCGRPGIAALVILNFLDSWNMVEQPLIFLKNSLNTRCRYF